jgi:hypothetical protein
VKHLLLQYLCGRGTTSCLECANNLDLPPTFHEYAATQDAIGWDNFIMGMTSHKLLAIQSAHFHTAGKSYLATRWITGLITQLLQVTHTQWIYRCMLVHDRTTGTIITAHKADLLKEIEHQLTLLVQRGWRRKTDFSWSAILMTSHPPRVNSKATGCWGSKRPERCPAYATKLEWRRKADPGNDRDGHETYTVPTKLRHMLNSATRQLNNSQARYKLG